MFPAQALAEAMLAKGWRVKLTTDARGARYVSAFPEDVEIERVASATFARGGLLAKLGAPFTIAAGVFRAVGKMRRDKPKVVIGFGGYPTIPAMSAAWLLRRPRAIHEQNGVLGRVNRFFARRVSVVACGTWPTDLPNGTLGHPTGNPVRTAILNRAGAPFVPPTGAIHLLVLGGSQGARILSDVVPEALAGLRDEIGERLAVSHQARAEDVERVVAAYSNANIPADVQTFFTDVPERMAAAQLVIARSGASTVADLTVIGRPSILIPYGAATGDHQTANARGLVQAGAAILIPESKFNAQTLIEHVTTVLTQPDAAAQMAAAAQSVGHPDATEKLVEIVESLAATRR